MFTIAPSYQQICVLYPLPHKEIHIYPASLSTSFICHMKSSSPFRDSFLSWLLIHILILVLSTATYSQPTRESRSRGSASLSLVEKVESPQVTLMDGNALSLNGVSSFVRVLPNPDLNVQGPFSLELWAYMDNWSYGGPARTGIVSKNEHGTGGYEFGLDLSFSSKTVGFTIPGCGMVQVNRTTLAAGWHHFIATYDGRNLVLFVDGQTRTTFNAGAACNVFYPYGAELRFGRSMYNQDYGTNLFKGQIDEVRLYRRLLSLQDAIFRYNSGNGVRLPDSESGLISSWHFDEGGGTVAASSRARLFDGFIQNHSNFLPRFIPSLTAVGIEVTRISTSRATVEWRTSVDSTSKVEYGLSPDLGTVVSSTTLGTGHSLDLIGLAPLTTYYFKVEGRTASGEVIDSKTRTFVTLDLPPSDQNFYVSADGSPLGNGSYGSPWDLQTALSHPTAVRPGATIWLRGGRYYVPLFEGGFRSTLTGTPEAPIKIQSAPNEWAVIDGNVFFVPTKNRSILTIQGAYTWFLDLEITNSDPAGRKMPTPGSDSPERRGAAIDDYSIGSKLINLVIHDTGQGIGAWQQGHDNEYYGNIIYNNGWDGPDRTHGHGVYTQNNSGYKKFVDNVIFNPFSATTRTGGTDDASVRNYTFEGNVIFNGIMAWLGPNIENLRVYRNYTYNQRFKVGHEINSTYVNADVRDNFFMSGVQLFEFSNGLTFRNNTVWNNDPLGKNVAISTNAPSPRAIFNIGGNTYYRNVLTWPYWQFMIAGGSPTAGDYAFDRVTGTQVQTYNYTGKSWRDDLLFDNDSTYVDSPPSGAKVFTRRNQYDPSRMLVVIYNWDQRDVVEVSTGVFLRVGDRYELRNVQDYFGDVIEGTFRGVSINVPMRGRTQARPIGYDDVTQWHNYSLPPNTFPKFGVFILRKKARPAGGG
ncbi:MAG TPA: LamG-like jellyroll fold domain-containing protein [Pyrinomonadaceae bacterium]